MLIQILQSDFSPAQKAFCLIFLPLIVLFSLGMHEYGHALVSTVQGDPTPKRAGRLTLNPIKHLHPIGTVFMLLCGFGWAVPVPVNPRYYKDPKKGMAITGAAGPIVNLVIGVYALVTLSQMVWFRETGFLAYLPFISKIPAEIYTAICDVLYITFYCNIMLAVFNLIPISPLDGSRILYAVLPTKYYFKIMRYERVIVLIPLLLLWTGAFTGAFEVVADNILTLVSTAVFKILGTIAEILLKFIS